MDKKQDSKPTTECPACHAEGPQGATFCWDCGTLLKTNGGAPRDGSRHLLNDFAQGHPAQPVSPRLPLPQLPTRPIDFWQGLALGLFAAVVVLFLLALAA